MNNIIKDGLACEQQKALAKEFVNKLDTYQGQFKKIFKSFLIVYAQQPFSEFGLQLIKEHGLTKVSSHLIVNEIIYKLCPETYDFKKSEVKKAYETLKQYAHNVKKYAIA